MAGVGWSWLEIKSLHDRFQCLWILERNSAAPGLDDAFFGPGAELFIDTLAGRAYEIRKILLRKSDFDRASHHRMLAVTSAERKQAFRNPPGQGHRLMILRTIR
jgi:hypothetical protein